MIKYPFDDSDSIVWPKNIWPFIRKLWVKIDDRPFEHPDLTREYLISENEDSVFSLHAWIVKFPDEIGVYAQISPFHIKGGVFDVGDLEFWITRVETKGGVVLKTPDDIMDFFDESYNRVLESEFFRKWYDRWE